MIQARNGDLRDESEGAAHFPQLVDTLYEQGKAENVASYLKIDGVVDPADSRRWPAQALCSPRPA